MVTLQMTLVTQNHAKPLQLGVFLHVFGTVETVFTYKYMVDCSKYQLLDDNTPNGRGRGYVTYF